MLFGTFIHILTSLIRDFCTSDRNFASTFFQIPPHDGHPWSGLVVGHCDYNPHNRLSLSRYMPCPAYQKDRKKFLSYFVSIPNSFNCAGSTGLGACAIKSDALALLGNATTSRMLSVPAKIIVKRSRPIPTPP